MWCGLCPRLCTLCSLRPWYRLHREPRPPGKRRRPPAGGRLPADGVQPSRELGCCCGESGTLIQYKRGSKRTSVAAAACQSRSQAGQGAVTSGRRSASHPSEEKAEVECSIVSPECCTQSRTELILWAARAPGLLRRTAHHPERRSSATHLQTVTCYTPHTRGCQESWCLRAALRQTRCGTVCAAGGAARAAGEPM